MPHRLDGSMIEDLPQRPERNALPDRIQDVLDRVVRGEGSPEQSNTPQPQSNAPDGSHAALLAAHSGLDVEAPGRNGQGVHFAQLYLDHLGQGGGDGAASPDKSGADLGSEARVSGADAGATALQHFDVDADLGRHLDHYNSQALSLHPDWFML